METSEMQDSDNGININQRKMKRIRKLRKRSCPICEFEAYQYHQIDVHVEETHRCFRCGVEGIPNFRFHDCPMIGQGGQDHVNQVDGIPDVDQSVFKLVQKALKGVLVYYSYTLPTDKEDVFLVKSLIELIEKPLFKLLSEVLEFYKSIRVNFKMSVNLVEVCSGLRLQDKIFGTNWTILTNEAFIRSVVLNCASYLIESLNVLNELGSQWTIERINFLQVQVGQYKEIRGRSYIPLPKCLKGRHGLINIKESAAGNDCFELCILCYLHGEEIIQEFTTGKTLTANLTNLARRKLERASAYKRYKGKLSFDGIDVSKGISLDQIERFEELNKISVTVFMNDGEDVYRARIPPKIYASHVKLLQLEEDGKAHFVFIRQIEKFLGQHNKNAHVYCDYCLKPYRSKQALSRHICGVLDKPQANHPKNDYFSFNKLETTMRFPFVVYLYLQQLEISEDSLRRRKVIGFSAVIIDEFGQIYSEKHGRGKFALQTVLFWLNNKADELLENISSTNLKSEPTEEQLEHHRLATHCEICGVEFSNEKLKQFDHNHRYFDGSRTFDGSFTGAGQYRASICSSCNLAKKYKKLIPCFIHSSSRHDFHFLVESASAQAWVFSMKPINRKEGEIMGLKINNKVQFKDLKSFKMNMTLEQLAAELFQSAQHFLLLENKLESKADNVQKLLYTGLFYIPSFNSLEEFELAQSQTRFPSPGEFKKNSLGVEMTKEDYWRCQSLWNLVPNQTFADYVELVMTINCLLLAQVGENYRVATMTEFKIDPSCFFSESSVSFHSAFLFEKARIEFVKCPRIRKMARDSIFGPIQTINRKYLVANSERLGNFDPSKPRVEILYVDLVGSYAAAFKLPIAIGNYQMMTQNEIDVFNFEDPDTTTGKGFLFRCSVMCPDRLHDKFDLPLMQEKREIRSEEISESQKACLEKMGKNLGHRKRLLLTLAPVENVCLHYRFLSYLLKKGLVLTSNITEGCKFDEQPIFSNYVQYNCIKKAEAKTTFERNFYKGKYCMLSGRLLMDTLRDYSTPEFVFNSLDAKKWLVSNRFKNVEIMSPNCAMFELKKTEGREENFLLQGSAILSHAKLIFYERFYDGLCSVFGDRLHIGTINTDSALVSIDDPNQTFLSDLKKLKDIFYFGNLPTNHILYDKDQNFGIPGVWQIVEPNIIEFLGMRHNAYSLKFQGTEKELIKCSGLEKSTAAKCLRHENFRKALLYGENGTKVDVSSVQMVRNSLTVVQSSRVSLSLLEMGRYHTNDLNITYPYGHYRIRQMDPSKRTYVNPEGQLYKMFPICRSSPDCWNEFCKCAHCCPFNLLAQKREHAQLKEQFSELADKKNELEQQKEIVVKDFADSNGTDEALPNATNKVIKD